MTGNPLYYRHSGQFSAFGLLVAMLASMSGMGARSRRCTRIVRAGIRGGQCIGSRVLYWMSPEL